MADDPYKQKNSDFPDPYENRSDGGVWSQADRAAATSARERRRDTRVDRSQPTSTSQDLQTPGPEMPARPSAGGAGRQPGPAPGERRSRGRSWSWLITGAVFLVIIIINAIRSAS